MATYYDWEKTLSYDADVTMVIGARGYGKTYGLRRQFLRDYIRSGYRFCEVVRYKDELSSVAANYFERLLRTPEFDQYICKYEGRKCYIAKKPEGYDDVEKKPRLNWDVIGYFIPMTGAQSAKKKTYDRVRRIVLDEAVIDRTDRYHTYLPNEFVTLANIVDTVSRERADAESIRPRVYLLGNACDFGNPYFAAYGVTSDLKFGYRWFRGKTFLLHYVDSGDYGTRKIEGTVAGRMMAGTDEALVAAGNEFTGMSTDFVQPKTKAARFNFGIRYNGTIYGVWSDMREGLYYVTKGAPNNATPIYYLSNDQSQVNYIAAKKTAKVFQVFAEAYYLSMIRYDSVDTKRNFLEVLNMFGVR